MKIPIATPSRDENFIVAISGRFSWTCPSVIHTRGVSLPTVHIHHTIEWLRRTGGATADRTRDLAMGRALFGHVEATCRPSVSVVVRPSSTELRARPRRARRRTTAGDDGRTTTDGRAVAVTTDDDDACDGARRRDGG